ncbi:MAG: YHS domain-containing protein [Planctomycetaceae bacterium]
MSDLYALEQQIQQRLKSVEEKERSRKVQLQTKMAEIEKRHTRFETLADELMTDVIDSRMEKLAGFFDNAELLKRNEAGKHDCVCRFHHTARYPASVKLTLSVAHDAEIEDLVLVYDLEVLPIFFKFDGHDQAAFSLNDSNRERVADWVDEKILAFVDTYLRLEQSDQYQQNNLVTDPVCGMRFRRSIASAETEHAGHTYCFCSAGCYEKFTADPQRYISN